MLSVSWNEKFRDFELVVRDNCGDPNIPQKHPTHGAWLNNQRIAYKAGKLSADRIKALESLGVLWAPVGNRWDVMFEGLKAIARDNDGNPNVPQSHPTHGVWLNKQRAVYKKGKMAADRIKELEALGVLWTPFEDRWDAMFEGLKAIAYANGGNPNVSKSYPLYGLWLRQQRALYKNRVLAPDRVQALEAIGVKWSLR